MKALHAGHLLRLVGRELQEEKQRLFAMFAATLLAGLLLFCGLLSLSALIVVAAWDTQYRAYAMTMLTVFYLAGAALAWRRFETLERQGDKAMQGTRQELADTLRRIEKEAGARDQQYPQSMTMQLLTQEPGVLMFLVTELLPSLLRRIGNRRRKRRQEESEEQS